jgi:hypothetical protein
MSQTKYSNAYPPMFNIPNRPMMSMAVEREFRALTACEENNGYKLAKTIRTPRPTYISVAPSRVVESRWEEPSHRALPSGAQVKIVHAFEADGFVPEDRSTRAPREIRSKPDLPVTLHASENVIQLRPNERCPRGLKRVKTINRRAGKAIKERRAEDKENLDDAKFYASYAKR